MQPIETTIIEVLPENIPKALKRRPQWVNWRLELDKDGRPTKRPYIAATNQWASVTDSLTWKSFEEVMEALSSGEYDGVGFVFSSGDGYTGIDLDECRDPETDEIDEWAQEWIARFDGYTEASASGTGVHIIVRGKTPHNGKKTVDGRKVEIYSIERFFTFTGVVL